MNTSFRIDTYPLIRGLWNAMLQTSTNFLLPDRPSFPIILFELSQYGSEFPREIEGRVGLPFIEYT